MTIFLGLLFGHVYFISDRGQHLQAKLLFLQGWALVSGTEYLDLDQVERDFCSARQAYAQAQQEEITEEGDLCPNSQEVSLAWSLLGGVVRGNTLTEVTHLGPAL